MAVVAQSATRQEKEHELLRPLYWASTCGMGGAIATGLAWFNSNLDMAIVAGFGLGTILAMTGLLLWGLRRLQHVARGRY